jgi:lipoate-protein ligase A
MKPFPFLRVWCDPVARSGPQCMAVDELLLQGLEEEPVLRFYDWEGAWVSVGYFGDLEAAQECFGESVSLVRRWTGGGVVDHRDDITYSLMIPRDHAVAKKRGAESYALIHGVVAEALRACGVEARLIAVDGEGDSAQCFEKPVAWDVVDAAGNKLAGAGQRRTRWGLLHQGSVQLAGEKRAAFRAALAEGLAEEGASWSPEPSLISQAEKLAGEKYS